MITESITSPDVIHLEKNQHRLTIQDGPCSSRITSPYNLEYNDMAISPQKNSSEKYITKDEAVKSCGLEDTWTQRVDEVTGSGAVEEGVLASTTNPDHSEITVCSLWSIWSSCYCLKPGSILQRSKYYQACHKSDRKLNTEFSQKSYFNENKYSKSLAVSVDQAIDDEQTVQNYRSKQPRPITSSHGINSLKIPTMGELRSIFFKDLTTLSYRDFILSYQLGLWGNSPINAIMNMVQYTDNSRWKGKLNRVSATVTKLNLFDYSPSYSVKRNKKASK